MMRYKKNPKYRTVTYNRILVDYRPQKANPNRVRVTVGGNLLSVPGDLSTRAADLIISNLLCNSLLSTKMHALQSLTSKTCI